MRKRNKYKYLVACLVIAMSAVIAFSAYCYILLNNKIDVDSDVKVRIKYNSSISEIVHTLNAANLLKPNWLFEKIVKFYAYSTSKSILAGYHKFPANITNAELIESLFYGENLYIKHVVFPEGINIKRFAQILNRQLGMDSAYFVALCRDKSLIAKYKLNAPSLEGYLMPATFNFFIDISPEEVLDILVDEQQKVWKQFENAAKNTGLSQNAALTMASIIEAETPIADERPTISGVYHNRLKKGMLLQADPTVQYAIGTPKKRLLYSDLAVESRYNTYKYQGLPPGPINSPSQSSIAAAVSPEKNDYLYFVAIGDGSNRHQFSKTYKEHLKKVAEFRKNRKK